MNKKQLWAITLLLTLTLACQGLSQPVLVESATFPPPSPVVQFSGEPNSTPNAEAQSQSQIILVIDISGSMASYVIPSPPPEELRNLLDDIYAVENDPDIKVLEDQLDAIRERPEIKEAEDKLSQAEYEKAKYIQDALGVDLFDLTLELQEKLIQQTCQEYLVTGIMGADSTEDATNFLENNCSTMPGSEVNEIANMLAFLNNSQVQELASKAQTLDIEYDELIERTNYEGIERNLESLYDNSGYYNLNEELEKEAQRLGLPTRLDFAKSAAFSIFDLMELDQRAGGQNQQIGLVVFTTYAKMLLPLTTNIENARIAVKDLEEQNMTNLGGGLEIALEMSEETKNPTTIILLSDGWANVGHSRSAIMGSLSGQAKTQGIRVCSTGFGTKEDDVDSDLLSQIAKNTGGKYLFTSSGGELVSFFIACRQSTVYENVDVFQGPVDSGQVVTVKEFEVAENTAEMTLSLNFINGDLTLLITDPKGEQVFAGYPLATQTFSSGLQVWKVEKPMSGVWKIEVKSNDTGKNVGVYHVVVSTKPGTAVEKNILLFGGVLLAGGICLTVAFIVLGGLLYFFKRKSGK